MKHYNVAFIGRKKGGELKLPIMKFSRHGHMTRVIPKMIGGKLFHMVDPVLRRHFSTRMGNTVSRNMIGHGLKPIKRIKHHHQSSPLPSDKRGRIQMELKKAFQ
jgi:hypothetical protein